MTVASTSWISQFGDTLVKKWDNMSSTYSTIISHMYYGMVRNNKNRGRRPQGNVMKMMDMTREQKG